ncbi:MAG: T9SS type A sorting domain-containing protein, partial [FCB group bacterium]
GQVSAPSVYRAYRIINRMNAVSLNISGKGDYSFNDSIYKTGATISVSSINGSGLTCIEKHNYAPPTGEYIDSSFSFIYPYRWVFSQNGISNISGIIKINASAIPQLGNPNQVSIYKRDQEASGIFEELITVYDSISGEITANFTGFGEFTIGSKTLGVLSLIYPDDNEINIQVNGILQWNKLPGATNYQIQVSTSQDFEKPIIDYIVGAQLEYDYQKLSYDTKYYWRVRGFNSKDVSEWSNPYSFTTEMLTSVEANYNINDGLFKFYPNPATDKIQFSDKRYTGTKYYIINMQGITLLEGIIVSDNIEISYLCPGAYFVKIGNDLIRFIKK